MNDCVILCPLFQAPVAASETDQLFAGPKFGQSERPTLWLDDIVLAAAAVIKFVFPEDSVNGGLLLPQHVTKEFVSRVEAAFYSIALEFAWRRSISLQGKTYRHWSALRPVLQELIHKTLSEMKSSGDSADAGSLILGSGGGGRSRLEKGIDTLLASCAASVAEGEDKSEAEVKDAAMGEGNGKDSKNGGGGGDFGAQAHRCTWAVC